MIQKHFTLYYTIKIQYIKIGETEETIELKYFRHLHTKFTYSFFFFFYRES